MDAKLDWSQRDVLYDVHAQLQKLHETVCDITTELHARGHCGGKVLDAQIAITNAMCAVSEALA